jgi:hypothetical protein
VLYIPSTITACRSRLRFALERDVLSAAGFAGGLL